MIIVKYIALFACIITVNLASSQSVQSCFKLKQIKPFIIGQQFNVKTLKINYGIDNEGANFGKKNGLIDYGSVDTAISIIKINGQISGGLSFTLEEKTRKLISLNCFWVFMIGDNKNDRLNGLKEIKTKFLNCLKLEKIDILKRSQYSVTKNNLTETFTLVPRIGEDGIDVSYWYFYYSIK